VIGVVTRRGDLRRPFPPGFVERLKGCTVLALSRRAKYLLAELSSGETLLMHLGMSGSFRVDRAERGSTIASVAVGPHDHVAFHMSSGAVITFTDPRRFGVMDLVASAALTSHPSVGRLGPEPLSADFDATRLAQACAGRKVSLKAALLDQRVVAGLGNIYASEALHMARLSPLRRASSIATPTGTPRPTARRLSQAIRRVLQTAIDRADRGTDYRTSRFRVYDRAGQPCPRPECGGVIRQRTQAGRSTFYCPVCQR
jgi:formamidopyrimidine-DNA glycosylase